MLSFPRRGAKRGGGRPALTGKIEWLGRITGTNGLGSLSAALAIIDNPRASMPFSPLRLSIRLMSYACLRVSRKIVEKLPNIRIMNFKIINLNIIS